MFEGTAFGTNIFPVSELGEMFVLTLEEQKNGNNETTKENKNTERTFSAKSEENPANKSAGISCAQAGTWGVQSLSSHTRGGWLRKGE